MVLERLLSKYLQRFSFSAVKRPFGRGPKQPDFLGDENDHHGY